jgi:TolB-like protein
MFGELRRRHILEIGLVYLGVGWLFIEITDFIVGNYGFSRKGLDTVVMLAILGFPAFLIIGWYHGEKGAQRVRRGEMWLLATLGTLAAIGTFRIATADEPFMTGGDPPRTTVGTADSAIDQQLAAAPGTDLGRRSLAVLPFKNNVADTTLAWLGSGLADLLTTNFAQVPELRVVGRQSLFDLLAEEGRSEQEEIPESLAYRVARAAGAHTMLWGSISGSVEDLVIDAQLIELENGTVVAAERVRGSDVFALVDSLTVRLRRRLGGDQRAPQLAVGQLGTRDMEALAAFQEGMAAERAGRLDRAEVLFEEAVRIDSTFVLPLFRLAGRGEVPDDLEGFDGHGLSSMDMDELQGTLRGLSEQLDDGDLDAEEQAELERLRAEFEWRSVEAHKSRARRLIQRWGADLASRFEGMTADAIVAKIDSTVGRSMSTIRVNEPDLPRDSLRRPIRPSGRPRPDGGNER